VWDQEGDTDALTHTGLQELVSVMGAQVMQQEQGDHLVAELLPSFCDHPKEHFHRP
jgi:hypothetical protein